MNVELTNQKSPRIWMCAASICKALCPEMTKTSMLLKPLPNKSQVVSFCLRDILVHLVISVAQDFSDGKKMFKVI